MTDQWAAFNREMDRLERQARRGQRQQAQPQAQAAPQSLTPRPAWEGVAQERSIPSQEEAERAGLEHDAQQAAERAAREYSPLPDELGWAVPPLVVAGDVIAAGGDAALGMIGDRAARQRSERRDERWERGGLGGQAGRDVLAEGHGGELLDWIDSLPEQMEAGEQARRHGQQPLKPLQYALGRALMGPTGFISQQPTPDIIQRPANVVADIWTSWPEAGREARGRAASEDVIREYQRRESELANARGDDLGARSASRSGQMAEARGNRAAGDDFWITGPAALEFAPEFGIISGLSRVGARQALRGAGQEIPEALARQTPFSEIQPTGQMARDYREGIRDPALAAAGGYALAEGIDGESGDDPLAATATAGLAFAGARALRGRGPLTAEELAITRRPGSIGAARSAEEATRAYEGAPRQPGQIIPAEATPAPEGAPAELQALRTPEQREDWARQALVEVPPGADGAGYPVYGFRGPRNSEYAVSINGDQSFGQVQLEDIARADAFEPYSLRDGERFTPQEAQRVIERAVAAIGEDAATRGREVYRLYPASDSHRLIYQRLARTIEPPPGYQVRVSPGQGGHIDIVRSPDAPPPSASRVSAIGDEETLPEAIRRMPLLEAGTAGVIGAGVGASLNGEAEASDGGEGGGADWLGPAALAGGGAALATYLATRGRGARQSGRIGSEAAQSAARIEPEAAGATMAPSRARPDAGGVQGGRSPRRFEGYEAQYAFANEVADAVERQGGTFGDGLQLVLKTRTAGMDNRTPVFNVMRDGKKIGIVDLAADENGLRLHPSLEAAHRRQNIGTQLYQYLERMSGQPLSRSDNLTEAGAGLWRRLDRNRALPNTGPTRNDAGAIVAGTIGGGGAGALLSGDAEAEDGSGADGEPLLPVLAGGTIGAVLGARGLRSSVGMGARPAGRIGTRQGVQHITTPAGRIEFEAMPDGWHIRDISVADGAPESARIELFQRLSQAADEAGQPVLMGQRHAPGSSRAAMGQEPVSNLNAGQAPRANTPRTEADFLSALPTDPEQWREVIGKHPWINTPTRAQLVIMMSARRPDGRAVFTTDEIINTTGFGRNAEHGANVIAVLANQARNAGVPIPRRARGGSGGATGLPGGQRINDIIRVMERAEANGQYLTSAQIGEMLGLKKNEVDVVRSQVRNGTAGRIVPPDLLARFRAVDEAQSARSTRSTTMRRTLAQRQPDTQRTDLTRTGYHATTENVQGPLFEGNGVLGRGAYHSDDPRIAEAMLTEGGGAFPEGANIVPERLPDLQRYVPMSQVESDLAALARERGLDPANERLWASNSEELQRELLNRYRSEGYVGIHDPSYGDGMGQSVTWGAENRRAPWARMSQRNRGSSDPLAGVAAGGLIGAGALLAASDEASAENLSDGRYIQPIPEGTDLRDGRPIGNWQRVRLADGEGLMRGYEFEDGRVLTIIARQGPDLSIEVLGTVAPGGTPRSSPEYMGAINADRPQITTPTDAYLSPNPGGQPYEEPEGPSLAQRLMIAGGAGLIGRIGGARAGLRGISRDASTAIPAALADVMATGGEADPRETAALALSAAAGGRIGEIAGAPIARVAQRGIRNTALDLSPEFIRRRQAFAATLPDEAPSVIGQRTGADFYGDVPREAEGYPFGAPPLSVSGGELASEGFTYPLRADGALSPREQFLASSALQQERMMERAARGSWENPEAARARGVIGLPPVANDIPGIGGINPRVEPPALPAPTASPEQIARGRQVQDMVRATGEPRGVIGADAFVEPGTGRSVFGEPPKPRAPRAPLPPLAERAEQSGAQGAMRGVRAADMRRMADDLGIASDGVTAGNLRKAIVRELGRRFDSTREMVAFLARYGVTAAALGIGVESFRANGAPGRSAPQAPTAPARQ